MTPRRLQVAVLYALAEWRLSESKPVRETLLTAVRCLSREVCSALRIQSPTLSIAYMSSLMCEYSSSGLAAGVRLQGRGAAVQAQYTI